MLVNSCPINLETKDRWCDQLAGVIECRPLGSLLTLLAVLCDVLDRHSFAIELLNSARCLLLIHRIYNSCSKSNISIKILIANIAKQDKFIAT